MEPTICDKLEQWKTFWSLHISIFMLHLSNSAWNTCEKLLTYVLNFFIEFLYNTGKLFKIKLLYIYSIVKYKTMNYTKQGIVWQSQSYTKLRYTQFNYKCNQICQNVTQTKTHFWPIFDAQCWHKLTIQVQVYTTANSSSVCFYPGLFMTSTSAGVVFKWLHLARQGKQPAGNCHMTCWWHLSLIWLHFVICGTQNGLNWHNSTLLIFWIRTPATLWLHTGLHPPRLKGCLWYQLTLKYTI